MQADGKIDKWADRGGRRADWQMDGQTGRWAGRQPIAKAGWNMDIRANKLAGRV